MALLNDLIKTYDSVIGHEPEGMKEKIAPIAHQYKKTSQVIDVTIDSDGNLVQPGFRIDDKNDELTLIAVTEASSSRTGKAAAVRPHGLNDNLKFMVKKNDNKSYFAYRNQLEEWCDSEDACAQAKSVLRYILKHNIIDDMRTFHAIPIEKDGTINSNKYMNYTVRWRVLTDKGDFETWKNEYTIASWTAFYEKKHIKISDRIVECISGNECDRESFHTKPIKVNGYENAKLISVSTEEKNILHFEGERFTNRDQLPQLGYQNSQKIHNALGWLIATQAITISKSVLPSCKTDNVPKYIVCWMPEIPQDESADFQLKMLLGQSDLTKDLNYQTYTIQMKRLIFGTGTVEDDRRNVSILMIDRSGDGRFSPVMYKSFSAEEYIEKIGEWHHNCAWFSYDQEQADYIIKPVSLFEIAKCAYGIQRFNQADVPYFDVDDAVFKDTLNTLLSCVLDNGLIPESLMRKMASQVSPERFSGNKGYEMQPFDEILKTACALLHWMHVREDKKKGGRDLQIDKENTDRSYLYGRLLAVFDRIENSALNRRAKKDEQGRIDHRDTNAMRLWSSYVAHPSMCAANLQKCVIPYLSSLPYGLRTYYQDELTEIGSKLAETKASNRPLSPEYLHGFYLERAALLSRKQKETE